MVGLIVETGYERMFITLKVSNTTNTDLKEKDWIEHLSPYCEARRFQWRSYCGGHVSYSCYGLPLEHIFIY